jgi:uncharacterized integral membrane protein
MRYLALLITVPLTLCAVVFALSNTAIVSFSFPPFESFSVPLNLLGLCLAGGGFFFGALFVWLHAQKTRIECWKQTRRADRLEKEIDALRATAEALPAPTPHRLRLFGK